LLDRVSAPALRSRQAREGVAMAGATVSAAFAMLVVRNLVSPAFLIGYSP